MGKSQQSRHVLVVGSGASGMAAALAAARSGARTTVLEGAARIGGTTAISAGAAWLPANHLMAEAGLVDSPTDALAYVSSFRQWNLDRSLVEVLVTEAPRIARLMEELSPIRWQMQCHPDYFVEHAGARSAGRTLEPRPLDLAPEHAFVQDLVLKGAPGELGTLPFAFGEVLDGHRNHDVDVEPSGNMVTMGRGLISGLAIGALDLGVEIRTSSRAVRLVLERGAVVGLELKDGTELRGRVILASGGFERDPQLVKAFLRGPMTAPLGVATTRGDGLRMAMAAGADLGSMSEAWWCPAYRVPGERTWDDAADRFRIVFPSHRASPGSIMVDRSGRRFVNEAQNYNDLGRAMQSFHPSMHDFTASPSWLVFDSAYRQRYGTFLGATDPDWCTKADDLDSLALLMRIHPRQLNETISRFNSDAVAERDRDFGRGSFGYDIYHGDRQAPVPALGELRSAPFFALEVHVGALGTKGGPRTDSNSRVLRVADQRVLPGLYAAGNAAASPLGTLYPGGGATIGAALVFGTRAGEAAATD